MTDKTKKPNALVDTFATKAPEAARFGVGAPTPAEIQNAIDSRRDLNPTAGDFYRRDQ